MSTEKPENSEPQSELQEKAAIPVLNPEKQEDISNPKISQQIIYISQDSTDQIKNLFQPLKDEISTIDRVYEGGVSIPMEEEKIIIKKEIPGEKIKTKTKTTTVTTRTIKIVNGKEVSSTENVTTTVEKSQDKINGEKPVIQEIIIKKEETNNNINNKEKNGTVNMAQSNVTFGAPENINNYNSILTSSNVTFGFNNTNNTKVNLNNENNNNSNMSDSVDKSSEQGNNIVIEVNKEINEENKNEKEPQIKFGFKPNNSNVEQNEIKLDDNNVKFGFNKDIKDNKEMEIEPGEIKDEEKKEKIEEKKEEKEENKIPIFTGSLFNNDNNTSNNQRQSSIFDQKLFQNNDVDKNKIEDNNINININLLPETKINSIFDNTQNAQETFLRNNISLMNNNSNINNTEQPSATFNIQNNSEINTESLKTLNDKIKEGDIYNADSAKKTQTNPNLNIFSTLNINTSNENAPIPIPSTNKGKNPFKPDEPQNINIISNNNDNNIDTNDNLDTNETTINRGINININNNNNTKLSSPFASLGNKDKSTWFISPNQQAEEISVNPVFTGNPFSTVLDINKNKEQKVEDKSYKSSLFPGLEKADIKGNIIEEEKKSNPPFPGINNNQINNTKSNLFVDDNKEKNNDKNNKQEEKEGPFLSEIISIGIPKINEDNKENKEKKENKENKDNNPINNNLPQLKDIIQPKEKKEEEKLPESINKENIEEKSNNINNSVNKPEEASSENKENELIISDVLNSNLTQDNQNNNIPTSFNKSLFENINQENKRQENKENQNKTQIQPQTSQRKSLFGDLFLNKNDTNLNDILMNNTKSSGFMTENKDKNEPLFGTNDLNNNNNLNNLYENNQGKSILNSSAGLTLLGKEMTPIKSTNLTQTKIEEKEKKEEKQEKEEESDSEASRGNDEEEKEEKDIIKEPIIEIKERTEIKEKEIPQEESNINIIINNNNKSNNKPETNFAEEEINIEITLSDEENDDKNSSSKKQKPLNRKIYSDLIKKIYRITEKKKDDISIPEKKTVTIYDDILSQFLTDFEEKIKNLKDCYINTLIKRQLEKDPNKRRAIILEANLPKKRNEVKKVYKNMSNIIDNKLDNENKKYYYIEILKILGKYDGIADTEIKDDMKIYKINLKKQKNKQENKNDKIIKEKNVKQNKKGSYNIVNVAIFLIPLIYAGYFALTNLK